MPTCGIACIKAQQQAEIKQPGAWRFEHVADDEAAVGEGGDVVGREMLRYADAALPDQARHRASSDRKTFNPHRRAPVDDEQRRLVAAGAQMKAPRLQLLRWRSTDGALALVARRCHCGLKADHATIATIKRRHVTRFHAVPQFAD